MPINSLTVEYHSEGVVKVTLNDERGVVFVGCVQVHEAPEPTKAPQRPAFYQTWRLRPEEIG